MFAFQNRRDWERGCAQITAVGRPSRSKSATWFMGPGVDAFVQMYMHLEILLLPHSIQMKKEPGSPPTVLEFHEQSGVGEEMVYKKWFIPYVERLVGHPSIHSIRY